MYETGIPSYPSLEWNLPLPTISFQPTCIRNNIITRPCHVVFVVYCQVEPVRKQGPGVYGHSHFYGCSQQPSARTPTYNTQWSSILHTRKTYHAYDSLRHNILCIDCIAARWLSPCFGLRTMGCSIGFLQQMATVENSASCRWNPN